MTAPRDLFYDLKPCSHSQNVHPRNTCGNCGLGHKDGHNRFEKIPITLAIFSDYTGVKWKSQYPINDNYSENDYCQDSHVVQRSHCSPNAWACSHVRSCVSLRQLSHLSLSHFSHTEYWGHNSPTLWGCCEDNKVNQCEM